MFVDIQNLLNAEQATYRPRTGATVYEVVFDAFGEGPLFRVITWKVQAVGPVHYYLHRPGRPSQTRTVRKSDARFYKTHAAAARHNLTAARRLADRLKSKLESESGLDELASAVAAARRAP